ncbi:MAG: O-antigen ligase family protein [Gaiellaceae bacterium]
MSQYADRLVSFTFRLPGWATLLACSSLAFALGWAYVSRSTLALLPAALLASLPLVLSARVRVVVVVFGALTVFQSSDELTTSKLLYLFGLAVAFGAVVFRLPRLVDSRAYHDLAPMLRASVVTFGLVAASLPVSMLNDVPQKAWLRDVAPYILVACAPLFALDAQASMTARALRRLLVVGGTLGALGFTVTWLTNRAIADLSFIPVGLPTFLLAATAFTYGTSMFLHGNRRRFAWVVFTSLVFAMLLSTGTRTTLVLLAAPLVIAFGSQHRLAQRSLRLAVAVPVAALLVVFGAQGVVHVTNANREALSARADLLFSTGEKREDRSYIDRLAQTSATWDLFRSSPIAGVGPGTPIVWSDSFNVVHASTTVDSPLSFLAKFGLLGLIAAGLLVAGFVSMLRRLRARTVKPTVIQLALVGYGAIVVGWSLLQNPYDDKGLAIGLILLLAVATREAEDATRARQQSEQRTSDEGRDSVGGFRTTHPHR